MALPITLDPTLSYFLVPLINTPQSFLIDLAGITYTLTCKFNDADNAGWVIDIGDSDNNPIVCNIPLVTGIDLLGQLDYLGINGQLYVFTDGDDLAAPTLDNLGVNSNLYFGTAVTGGG